MKSSVLVLAATMALAGCGKSSDPAPPSQFGASPQLPAPQHGMIPTVHFARPVGWPAGRTPIAAPGLKVEAYARGLLHPRSLLALPNGDVLVAETNGPTAPRPRGLRGYAEKVVMGMVGAEAPSMNRILLLRGQRPDGSAAANYVYITGLSSPFGMALVGNNLYVADTDAVLRFPYDPAATHVAQSGVKVADLPAFPIDHHWTKTLAVSRDSKTLFVSVGSNSNIGENGIAAENGRALVLAIDVATGQKRTYAAGLRNAVGLDVDPSDGVLWAVVNERDELGDNLPPDYLTSVKDGGFYGWPYAYWGKHVDTRVKPQRPDLVAVALTPDYSLGAHVAPLGVVFYRGQALPPQWRSGAFVGEHGSWNRSVLSGYKVVFVPFANGRPSGPPVDALTGFLDPRAQAMGRPVGVVEDASGAILVADDVGNAVWRITAK